MSSQTSRNHFCRYSAQVNMSFAVQIPYVIRNTFVDVDLVDDELEGLRKVKSCPALLTRCEPTFANQLLRTNFCEPIFANQLLRTNFCELTFANQKGGEFRHGPAPENADVDAATMQRWGFRTAFGATPCRNGVRMNRRFIPQVYLHRKKIS